MILEFQIFKIFVQVNSCAGCLGKFYLNFQNTVSRKLLQTTDHGNFGDTTLNLKKINKTFREMTLPHKLIT